MIDIKNIPQDKFQFASSEGKLHDKKLETKPIGYLKDAWIRFRKNKSSIVGAVIVVFLVLFAIIGPYCFPKNYIAAYETDIDLRRYQYLTPKLSFVEPGSGFWDGTQRKTISETQYQIYQARATETGRETIVKVYESYETTGINNTKVKMYDCLIDTYSTVNVFTKQFTYKEYKAIQEYQNRTGKQVILPWVIYNKSSDPTSKNSQVLFDNINIWYNCDKTGKPVLNEDNEIVPGYKASGLDQYDSIRLKNDPAYGAEDPSKVSTRFRYSTITISGVLEDKTNPELWGYTVRLNPSEYFVYKYGFEPSFTFGSSADGYDIFTRLASGARFSLLFALAVSAINLFIGAIYGAIEGYYGGATDLIMERVSDILASIPTMVVTVLFNLHLAAKVGAVPALLYAFIMTGWIGMASRTRMQFYRFKNQEYVLAARTLGARDRRVMFKHIFPNSLGTLITGSVLVIPGVIYSETSLTYLGIINLDSATRSSVGAMLNAGRGMFTVYPHLVLFPSLFIGLLMVSFNLFGNGLRDAFNPSLRGTED